ncbi:MAG: MBL fold metallo-hydrolase [Planctomycetota bacterium]
MLPKPPPRHPQLGFIYAPPYRIQGHSVAGEATVVHVPELDLAFDIGACPKPVLPANVVALSHGHMDHIASIAYYFSQRHFQDMAPGHLVCPPSLEAPIRNLMDAWVNIEQQRTPHQITPLAPDDEINLKGHLYLRAFQTDHRVPSQGYAVIERRTKLKEEFAGLPQEQLVELKKQGTEITNAFQIPLIAYTGDTAAGPHLDRPEVTEADTLIAECTFLEPGHRGRARIGKHMHLDDILDLLEACKATHVILIHLSRRTMLNVARKTLDKYIPPRHRDRVHLLMDNRTNMARYDDQLAAAEAAE